MKEKIVSFLKKRFANHYQSEDDFLSCPLHPDYAGNEQICNCGKDEADALLEELKNAGVGAGRRFRGVVDQVASNSSNVTLFYDGRENEFVLPTPVLEGAGIAYMGALFEIVMKKEFGLNSYDIVHLHDEEIQARREAGAADLSFLDGLEARRQTEVGQYRMLNSGCTFGGTEK